VFGWTKDVSMMEIAGKYLTTGRVSSYLVIVSLYVVHTLNILLLSLT